MDVEWRATGLRILPDQLQVAERGEESDDESDQEGKPQCPADLTRDLTGERVDRRPEDVPDDEKEQQFGADGLLEGGLPRGFGGAGHVRLLCLRSRSVGVTGRRARPLRAVLPSGMSGRGLPTLRGCDADRNGPLSLRHRRGMCRAGTPDRTWNTPEVRVLGVDRG